MEQDTSWNYQIRLVDKDKKKPCREWKVAPGAESPQKWSEDDNKKAFINATLRRVIIICFDSLKYV